MAPPSCTVVFPRGKQSLGKKNQMCNGRCLRKLVNGKRSLTNKTCKIRNGSVAVVEYKLPVVNKGDIIFFAFCHPPCPILSISEHWTASGFGTEKKRAKLCTLRKILLEKMISMYGTFCTHFVFGNKTECYLVTQRVRQDWPFCDISVCGQFRCVVWATGSLHSQIFLCSCRFHAKHGSRYEWNRISSRLMWAVIATIFCIMS